MTECKLIPLGDRVVVEPALVETQTKSGIVLPEGSKEKSQEGTIIAVGSGLEGKIGDKIIYCKYSGTEVKLGSAKYIILEERDILAIRV